jgi:hypothetical protein
MNNALPRAAHSRQDVVMDDDKELTQTLETMRSIWIEAAGGSHAHLDALIDPQLRHDESTRNYLASGASGTLRDRIFSPLNGDRIGDDAVTSTNNRYRELLDEATRLSVRLNLPATADWTYAGPGQTDR